MKQEAASAGFYHSLHWQKDYPRIQLLTVNELLHGAEVKMPPRTTITFKRTDRADQEQGHQSDLGLLA